MMRRVIALLLATAALACGPRPAPRPDLARTIVPSSAPSRAPAASIPAPLAADPARLPLPESWTDREKKPRPLAFRIDLDLIAPLGDGPANAAVYFRDFAKDGGSRVGEVGRADARRVTKPVAGRDRSVLPPDDPLLAEAEPWVEQARMRFYPDVWPAAGIVNSTPNLLHEIRLCQAWVARAGMRTEPELEKEDCRRAVRLGRLILQDDVLLAQNLIGLACIRAGAEGLYEIARREEDAVGMLIAERVLHEQSGLRALADERLEAITPPGLWSRPWWAPWRTVARPTEADLDQIVATAKADPSRALRIEAAARLAWIAAAGSAGRHGPATRALDELTRDSDPLVASTAIGLRDAMSKGGSALDALSCLGGT